MSKPFHYGGQAVIEGVMMRGQKNLAIAVRGPSGEINITRKPLAAVYTERMRRIPLVRGVVVLAETLVLGVQSLLHSANVSLGEEEKGISAPVIGVTLGISLAFAVALFFMVPLAAVRLIESSISSSLLINIIEGLIRIGIFILYLGVINLIPDIRRVFAYHGAEHTVINAYEDGVPLEVQAVKQYSTAHTRCGTSFLFIILIIAIIVFALVGHPALWLRIVSRIILIPVIAAAGYEINRLAAAHSDNRFVHAFLLPGLTLQTLTTRKPDDAQLEVALAALKQVIEADTGEGGYSPSSEAEVKD